MEALVITLREGIEAALVVGIILAYLQKTGQEAMKSSVYTGLIGAILASVAAAVLVQSLGLDPENEYLEGAMMGVGGLLVASAVIWMWRVARGLRAEMESRLATITTRPEAGPSSGGAVGLGLLLFTFVMVFREGMETVLFLGAVTIGREAGLSDLLGGLTGLGLAILFAVLLVRGSLRINLARFFTVTSLVLLVLAVKLLAASVHEFGEVGLLPLTKDIMAILGYFVRDQSSTVITMAIIALPIFLLLWETLARGRGQQAAMDEGPAQRRKRRAAERLERLWQGGLAIASVIILLAMTSSVLAGNKFIDPTPQPVTPVAGQVRIPIASLDEGRLYKFVYPSEGRVEVRFLVAKLEDGTIGTALDACQICGIVGYGQEGGNAICKNCNAPIPMHTIGQGGGCNPLELKASVESGDILIAVSELEMAVPLFTG